MLPVAQAGERARGGLTTEHSVWMGPPGGNHKVDLRHRIPRERSKGWLKDGAPASDSGDSDMELWGPEVPTLHPSVLS